MSEQTPCITSAPPIKIRIKGRPSATEGCPSLERTTKIAIKIVKKQPNESSFTLPHTRQKLCPVPHDPIKLPPVLDLMTFYYQNHTYLLEQKTGYLFPPETLVYLRQIPPIVPVPIGQLVHETDDLPINEDSSPLSKSKIICFSRYELDVTL